MVGAVLADETGRPLPGATVRLVSGGVATTTDEAGKYSLPAESATAVLVAEAEGRTSVERELPVETGVGTVPVDARLTPLAARRDGGPGGRDARARRRGDAALGHGRARGDGAAGRLRRAGARCG